MKYNYKKKEHKRTNILSKMLATIYKQIQSSLNASMLLQTPLLAEKYLAKKLTLTLRWTVKTAKFLISLWLSAD
jgi:hypothetical protein